MIDAGLIGTCGIIELEVRFSARSHTESEQIRDQHCEWVVPQGSVT
jgi:hypothetical protein